MPGRTVYIETFGCQMNELDSELVCGQLRALGYAFTPSPEGAHVVLYNTCSVREHAEQKVWSRLGEMRLRKADNPALVVGVLGCMAERDGEALIRRMPVVDVLCGPGELDKLPALLDNALRTREAMLDDPPAPRYDEEPRLVSARQMALQGNASRRSSTLAAAQDSLELLDLSRSVSPVDTEGAVRRSAYVRITRGCNKFCTYCVVPFTRGAEVHRPPDHIVDECRRLADAGVVEITLLGQTVNHYRFEHGAAVTVGGVTQPQKGRSYAGGHRRDPFAGAHVTTFAGLLARIHEEVPAIARLRFVTSYPRDFGDDVLEVIRDHPRISRYLHVPAQSGSDRLLAMMNRGYTVGEYVEFIDRARAFLDQPEIGRPLGLAGDFIVGFPTETEADYEASAALVRRVRYKNAFIFKYSPRPGTVAIDKFADDVPEAVKRRRNTELLGLQTAICDEIGREHVGRTLDVLVEGESVRTRKRRAASACEPQGGVTLTIGGRALPGAPRPSDPPPEEGVLADEPVQLTGRTDTDLIVHFDAPAGANGWTGRQVRVHIERAAGLSVFGRVAHDEAPLSAGARSG
ncbi:MAG: MiaB/RimO family radical SAM methylthiotransferase [Planctomycetota bacterium]|nr:MiaB/RimO family radical SAM methylthiotransferase [Planctomycetota bacterium]